MPVTQLDIQLCNRLPWCITYQGHNYPVVQPDGLKATQLYNWTVWKLPGCTTGQAESFQLSNKWSENYPVVQPDGLKATWLYNRASWKLQVKQQMVWKLPGCTTGQAESFQLSNKWSESYLVVQPGKLKASS